MSVADTLSRYPVAEPDDEDIVLDGELEVVSAMIAAVTSENISVSIPKLKEYSGQDQEYQELFKKVQHGFYEFKMMECPVGKQYFHVKNKLSIVDDLIMYSHDGRNNRFLIPRKLRGAVMETLHSAHQGTDGALRRARETVFWPGITNTITQICNSCRQCIENSRSLSKEPLITSPVPAYPFQMAVADLFQLNGSKYLAFADRLTGWLEIAHFQHEPCSSEIIDVFRDLFHRFGVPEQLSLDGGPNISSTEVNNFLKAWGTGFRLSSAYYPQSNGRAEAAVKTSKRLIEGNTGRNGNLETDKVARGLLQYRNTPLKVGGKSPAQLLFGRSLRDNLPQRLADLNVNHHWTSTLRQRERDMSKNMEKSKAHHDKIHMKDHDALSLGTAVVCQNTQNKKWDRSGTIVERHDHRQYAVRMDRSGRVSLRNQIHLRPTMIRPHALIIKPTGNSAVCSPSASGSSSSTSSFTTPPSEIVSSPQSTSSSSASYQIPPATVRRSYRERRRPIRYGEWML